MRVSRNADFRKMYDGRIAAVLVDRRRKYPRHGKFAAPRILPEIRRGLRCDIVAVVYDDRDFCQFIKIIRRNAFARNRTVRCRNALGLFAFGK